jgi:hypothetical protein
MRDTLFAIIAFLVGLAVLDWALTGGHYLRLVFSYLT